MDHFLDKLIQYRRHLHAHPELSFQEYNTASFIEKTLKEIGVEKIERWANTGVVAYIYGNDPTSKCIALRADIDALPIQEENDAPYTSQNNGCMHACGHDVHTTCLLGAAELLWKNKEKISGTIKLIFQPGEELSPGGASLLIKEGVLENPSVQAIIGLHVSPDLKVGTLGFRSGAYMASADEIHLTFKGKGGHAAAPHLAVDTIYMAAQFIVQIQSSLNRLNNPLNPYVLSFGQIQGGSTTNVIPTEVAIKGTLRTFDNEWRKKVLEMIPRMAENLCSQMGGNFELEMPPGYPFLYNNPNLTEQVKAISEEYLQLKTIDLPMRMSSEDFAFYAQEIPACFFRLGTQSPDGSFSHPVHTAHFDVDESCLTLGAHTLYHAALHIL